MARDVYDYPQYLAGAIDRFCSAPHENRPGPCDCYLPAVDREAESA